MRGVIQEIDMASKPIEDPATQVASCDVPRAKLDIDYMTNKVVQVAARQRFSRHSNSEGLV